MVEESGIKTHTIDINLLKDLGLEYNYYSMSRIQTNLFRFLEIIQYLQLLSLKQLITV